jgi:Lrp/AsnC family transcriptional regulator
MDKIDIRLLDILQTDASQSVNAMAKKVGLSTTACWNRIQRLESEGVVGKRVALVNPLKVGVGMSVFVSIQTDQHSSDWLAAFAKKVTAMPEVVEFYRMSGDVDYMLRVLVSDLQAYDTFYKKLIDQAKLSNVTSRFAMECIKHTTEVPLTTVEQSQQCR